MKVKMHLVLLFSFALSSMAFAHDDESEGFSELVVFSGIFGDTGNYAAVFGDLPPLFWNNRYADGPVVADYFAENLGLSAEPSLNWIGEDNGLNYSIRDAWAAYDEEFGLNVMVDSYLEKTEYDIPDDALILLWIGGHDLIEAISTPGEIPYHMIDDAVDGIEAQLYRLIDAGAEHIFAPTYADTSFSPAYTRRGISDRVSVITNTYNRKFKRMLNRVERATGQRIYRFHFDEYTDALVNNHAFFSLKNITEPCLEVKAEGRCDLNTFMFLSDVLITSRTHKLIADAFTQDLLQQVSSCKKGNWHPRTKRWLCFPYR